MLGGKVLLGTTHVLFAVFLFLVLWRGGFVGLFVGFLSHLVLDSLTVRGVGWLLPFSRRRVHFVIATATMIERIFFFVLAVFSVVWGFPLVFEVLSMLSVLEFC